VDNRNDGAAPPDYLRGMLPFLLALPLSVLPFAALVGSLAWMALTSERPRPA
jgi:hypothetical protein